MIKRIEQEVNVSTYLLKKTTFKDMGHHFKNNFGYQIIVKPEAELPFFLKEAYGIELPDNYQPTYNIDQFIHEMNMELFGCYLGVAFNGKMDATYVLREIKKLHIHGDAPGNEFIGLISLDKFYEYFKLEDKNVFSDMLKLVNEIYVDEVTNAMYCKVMKLVGSNLSLYN